MMGYSGGKISDVTKRMKKGAELAGTRMGKLGAERMATHTRENTPVGEPPLNDPLGRRASDDFTHLRDKIDEKPTVYTGEAWESGAETDVFYAEFVEEGTGLWGPEHRKYKIAPKDPDGVLAFFARQTTPEGTPLLSGKRSENLQHGGMVFARFVMHPGSPGQHMFQIGAQMTELEIQEIGRQGVRTMKNYVERG